MDKKMQDFLENVRLRTPGEDEFHQAVQEFVESIWDFYIQNPQYQKAAILERMTEPERSLIFRVPWVDDSGKVHVNRGYRVQFNSAIGPYKGGIRFHSNVNLSTLKFLGFEQTFKNSLTSLPMGGGKGGADFNPRGKSDMEIMRFCQSYMAEMFRHIGPDTDIPAGDIGVGQREVGYMFGMYKKLTNEFTGVLTGKGREYGGSLIRPEATGYGVIYFINEILARHNDSISGKTVAISGFGNVAWGTAKKASELGAKVVTISGPDGYVYDPDGISGEKVDFMLQLRASNMDTVKPFAEKFGVQYFPGKKPWEQKVDIAIPCAIQNELDLEDAKMLVANGCKLIAEASNMGLTTDATIYALKHIIFAPGKAVNAGGVSVSGLEMTQNSMRIGWTKEEVDAKLKQIMTNIHETCVKFGEEPDGEINYQKGANISGFVKVAEAMLAQGIV
ncbi:NADP-specific glutamate dehydrogenase [Xiashengella succiniciproducens]|uniref:Glutamate dehydrogenase n=1 Tax=Xiashengella succiniciproducens TaxID=2949635 RepID=A0A9J6ZPC6_9BACT|nr:NADP-specific glutamate dehydrogenase [Alkaliflexus sp. Ai-910]URW79491.1 NADP-specific glutamate dehydrogenase [Alkaliflexus sp. Ai-910]